MPCGLVEVYKRFVGSYCLHSQKQRKCSNYYLILRGSWQINSAKLINVKVAVDRTFIVTYQIPIDADNFC
jgi:hypothetical protein